jgi:hypothetical protein
VLAVVPDERVRDIARMSWACYEALHDYFERPIVLNPTFAGSEHVGGADGDLIFDHRLVEMKTTADARLDQTWLLQLLGYVLLDWNDEYGIDGLGVLLARGAALACWSLDRILAAVGAAGMAELSALGADFDGHGPRARSWPRWRLFVAAAAIARPGWPIRRGKLVRA